MAVRLRVLNNGREFRIFAIEHNCQCRVTEFFNEAAAECPDDFARLVTTMELLADSGPLRNQHVYKPLRRGLHEIKVGALRLVCFQRSEAILCTHGFIKRTQKMPIEQFKTGVYLRAEFFLAEQKGPIETIE
jgi:phage-related protein